MGDDRERLAEGEDRRCHLQRVTDKIAHDERTILPDPNAPRRIKTPYVYSAGSDLSHHPTSRGPHS